MFVKLKTAQELADLAERLSLIQLSVNATPDSVKSFISALGKRLPGASVSGIKQFAEAEGRIYGRISGLLTSTVLLVLLLTSLCVMAGMSNVAVERKNDVGLMKAIGGSIQPGGAAVSDGSDSAGHRRRAHWFRGGHRGFHMAGKSGFRRGRGAAVDCVSIVCHADGARFHCQCISVAAAGQHSTGICVSR